MKNAGPLRVERLEDRVTPVAFGTAWPDGGHLSMSFAPDGTRIGGVDSDLGSLLAALGPQARLDVLRAFQAWAVNANVNIGLVNDSGEAFGTPGVAQGDGRFGDIRVGGRALPGDVLAVTAPYALHDGYSGDVVVNTAAGYGPEGVDLRTVLLQEAGHALGVGNSTDPGSVMYEYYRGARDGLSGADVAALQVLYGVREPDQFEGAGGNDTVATATPYSAGLLGLGGPAAADLTTTRDVDVFKFTTGLLTRSVTVDLTAAGLSLLTAKVDVLDSRGTVVASAFSTDPTRNDVTLTLPNARGLSSYYVRVSAAQPGAFGVGAYQLDVNQNSIVSEAVGVANQLLSETGVDDTLVSATGLVTGSLAVGPQTEFHTSAAFGSPSDVDYYRLTVPGAPGGAPVNMLVTAWGRGGAKLNPWLEVRDAAGHTLSTDVLTADGATTTVQASGLLPGRVYFIKAFSDSRSVGGYDLAADLRTAPVALPPLMSGALGGTNPSASAAFDLSQSGQVHFVVTADGVNGSVELTVADAGGRVVATATASVGRGRSVDVLLPAGTYGVSARTVNGSDVMYHVEMSVVTDPTGATSTDPNDQPQPTSPPPTPSPLPPMSPPPPPAPPSDPPPMSPPPPPAPPSDPPPMSPPPPSPPPPSYEGFGTIRFGP